MGVNRASQLSSDDWAMAAMFSIADGGVANVSIERLAQQLGATKGSAYWHFADRSALIAAALELWERLATTDVIEQLDHITDPRQRLRQLLNTSFGRSDSAIDSALMAHVGDETVGPIIRRVTHTRLAFVERALRQLGLSPARARRQARILYATYVGHLQLVRILPNDDMLSSVNNAYLRQLETVLLGQPSEAAASD
jgi:AcrR family transcriptional regulator